MKLLGVVTGIEVLVVFRPPSRSQRTGDEAD
jgi:hypothetical protein